MKNLWNRSLEMANILGLLLGSIGIIVAGEQMNNSIIISLGLASSVFFALLMFAIMGLLIRDCIYHSEKLV